MKIMTNSSVCYTWIFQVCRICAILTQKTYQKAEILHIWKIQVWSYHGLPEKKLNEKLIFQLGSRSNEA